MEAGAPVTLYDLLSSTRPETLGRWADNWPEHARQLWLQEPFNILRLIPSMASRNEWLGDPVVVDDGVVQDGHHRIVAALALGWLDREVPLKGSGLAADTTPHPTKRGAP